MKKLIRTVIAMVLALLMVAGPVAVPAMAATDGNIDIGGGTMGQGTEENYWRTSRYGVRITVVSGDGTVAARPFDLANCSVPDNTVHFGRICKLEYTNGQQLYPMAGAYVYSKPDTEIPRIISSGKYRASIEAIERYFCSEYAAKLVSEKTGIPYYDLICGDYKIVLEPVAYFTYKSVNYAMTATEAALYNQMDGGGLRQKMTSLTHKNLPLALFLEVADLGYPAWTGSTTDKVNDTQILSSLGIGIVNYYELRDIVVPETDYTYRADTDVITSVMLTSSEEVNPDEPASVTFYIDGDSYTVNDIVMPAGGSQLVWVKWHTPSVPEILTITVSTNGADLSEDSFTARIESFDDNIPPDPLATDTNPTFNREAVPHNTQKSTAGWSVWYATWEPKWEWESDWEWYSDWEWETDLEWQSDWEYIDEEWVDNGEWVEVGYWVDDGYWVDNGEWVDNGKYIFDSDTYNVTMQTDMEIHPDDIVPSAVGDTMKSGYGIKQFAWARYFTNAPSGDYTPTQTAVSYFPEFKYKTYCRKLADSGGNPNYFTFEQNPYSTYSREVHFTPIWFPDGEYKIYTYIMDAWTPVGMLAMNLTDAITIDGNMYDDWYSKRE